MLISSDVQECYARPLGWDVSQKRKQNLRSVGSVLMILPTSEQKRGVKVSRLIQSKLFDEYNCNFTTNFFTYQNGSF